MTPTTRTPTDRKRLSAQCATILAALRAGPLTVDELSRIARKYTGRISDLRAAGHRVTCHRVEGGNNVYTLDERPAVVFDGAQARMF